MRSINQHLGGLGNPLAKIAPDGWPVAAIRMFAGTGALPDGWLECDGSELKRTEYPDLYELIGTNFGTPSDVTKFVLPDFRGRTGTGLDGANTDSSVYTGAETTTLTSTNAALHAHGITGGTNVYTAGTPGTVVTVASLGTDVTISIGSSSGTQSAGPHNNMQPFLVVRFMIRT